jgi:hypothetical protein
LGNINPHIDEEWRVYIAQPSVFMSLLIYVRVYIAQSSVFMSLLVYVRVYIAQPSVFMSLLINPHIDEE